MTSGRPSSTGRCNLLVDNDLGGAQDPLVLALGEDDERSGALGARRTPAASPGPNDRRRASSFCAIGLHIRDRPARDAALHCGFGDGRRDPQQARADRAAWGSGNHGQKRRDGEAVSALNTLSGTSSLIVSSAQCSCAAAIFISSLILVVAYTSSAPRKMKGKLEHVVDHIGIIAARPVAYDHVLADGEALLPGMISGVGVRQREDQWVWCHPTRPFPA